MTAMPRQKPNRSEQVVGTPRDFKLACEAKFGPIALDLAADSTNHVAPAWFGPGSPLEIENALSRLTDWTAWVEGLRFLNPPYGDITPWAAKCATSAKAGARILLLVPASTGAEWFNLYIRPYAFVFELTPRIKFMGHTQGYPKDLILAYYGPEGFIGRGEWRWRPKRMGPANDNGVDPRQLALPVLDGSPKEGAASDPPGPAPLPTEVAP